MAILAPLRELFVVGLVADCLWLSGLGLMAGVLVGEAARCAARGVTHARITCHAAAMLHTYMASAQATMGAGLLGWAAEDAAMIRRTALTALLLPVALCGAADGVEISTLDLGRDYIVVTAPGGGYDAATEARLQARVTCHLVDAELQDVARFISRHTGANVVVDPKVIDAPTVSLQLTNVTARSVLEWTAQQAGVHLTFVNEAAYLTDGPQAGAQETRIYEVTDLTQPLRSYPGPSLAVPEPGGTGTHLIPAIEPDDAPRTSVDELADILEEHISE